MALIHLRSEIKFEVKDSYNNIRMVTKNFDCKINDSIYIGVHLQISAMVHYLNHKVIKFVNNSDASVSHRSYMGVIGITLARVYDRDFVKLAFSYLSTEGYKIGNLPVGQIASEKRNHIQYFSVQKKSGIGIMKLSAPEPELLWANQDIITIPADFVFPIIHKLDPGIHPCNRYGELIIEALYSKYEAKA